MIPDLAAFDYHLPEELIAQEPLPDRAASRMLVVDRASGRWQDCAFRELPEFLGPGDCLVLNDSRVFPARLYGHRTGWQGRVEVLLVRPLASGSRVWEALVRPGRKVRSGERIAFDGGLKALFQRHHVLEARGVFADAPTARAGEIAGVQRFELQDHRKFRRLAQFVFDDVTGDFFRQRKGKSHNLFYGSNLGGDFWE